MIMVGEEEQNEFLEEMQQARQLRQQQRQEAVAPFSGNQDLIQQQRQTPEIQSIAEDYKNYRGEGDFSEMRAMARDNKAYMAKANVLANQAAEAALSKIKHGDVQGAIKEGLKTAAEMGGQLGTAKILQFMWTNIYYVLPLLYINFHFVIRYIAGSQLFCRFGQEWTAKGAGAGKGATSGAAQAAKPSAAPASPPSPVSSGSASISGTGGGAGSPEQGPSATPGGDVQNLAGEIAEAPNRALELLEIAAMVLCNAIVALALLLVFLIIYFLATPCSSLITIFGGPDIANFLNSLGICK